MAYQIIWSKRAAAGYDRIIEYLGSNWSEKEVRNFVLSTNDFFETLSQYPEILSKTRHNKNLYRGPINKLTILTYRVKHRNKTIEFINIRGARQKPLK